MGHLLKFAGIKVHLMTREESLLVALHRFRHAPGKVFFVNAHCVNMAGQSQKYRQAVREADLVFNDGVGIEVLASALGFPVRDNLNGTDWIPALLRLLGQEGREHRVYFLGGTPELVDLKCRVIGRRWPGLKVVGGHHGFFKDPNDVLEDIAQARPEILLVGMGVPHQELFLHDHWETLKSHGVKLGIAGGAVADFLVGAVPRAPRSWRRWKIEWMYRLACEPKRMYSRYILGAFSFGTVVLREWWRRRSRKFRKLWGAGD